MQSTDTLIVGTGPAGLAMAGRLKQMNIPFVLLEQSDKIGNSWHHHYERLHLHTVKEHSGLPHWPIPDHYPVYVSRLEIIKYWEDYAQHLGIVPLFRHEVTNIQKKGDHWLTTTNHGTIESKRVVVATGYNRVPYSPHWPGQAQFKGKIIHSSLYRNAKPYVGQKVLLIGIGNTGAELALDLAEGGAKPSISVRSPVNFIKRDTAGRPAQRTAIMLSKFPTFVADFLARLVQKITIGNLSPYGIIPSPYAPSEQIRKTGKVPIIDIGTVALIKQRKILIAPDVDHFNEDSVTFVNGLTEPFDQVILCTGFKAKVEELIENSEGLINERGYPKGLWFDEERFKGLYFCGFSVPLSGILRNILLDSEKIAAHIQAEFETNS